MPWKNCCAPCVLCEKSKKERDAKALFCLEKMGLSDATGLADRGVFARPTLYVLRRTKMPALLLEIGFITNSGDARLMAENPNLIARGIYNGILRYYGF